MGREAAFLSAAVPSFDLAQAILKRIGQIEISKPSVWRSAQEAGERFQALEAVEQERANALPEQWEPPSRAEVVDQRMGVSMDRASIYVRQEGWKELKIGVVFDIAVGPTQDKETGEIVDLAHATNNSYVAHLGGPDTLGEKTWAEARPPRLGAGAGHRGSWRRCALDLESGGPPFWREPSAGRLVSCQRASRCSSTFAETGWHGRILRGGSKSRETLLYQGHADKIAAELDKSASKGAANAAELITAANYFRTNQHRMNYIEMREEEWPIGSGMVESGAKQFKARFSGAGMRWSRTGAENLLPIRAAVLSGRFDEMWADAKKFAPNLN